MPANACSLVICIFLTTASIVSCIVRLSVFAVVRRQTTRTPNGLTSTCLVGGTVTATAGSGSISLSGATLGAGADCQVTVNVTATTLGTKVNSVTVNSNEGTGNTATIVVTTGEPAGGTMLDGLPLLRIERFEVGGCRLHLFVPVMVGIGDGR